MTHLRSLLLAAAALVVSAAPASAAARMPSKKFVHPDHGFLVKLIADWTQTPTQPGERVEVAKFKSDERGREFASLSIFRYGPAAAQTRGEGPPRPEGVSEEQWEAFLRRFEESQGRGSAKDRLLDIMQSMQQRMGLETTELPGPDTTRAGSVEAQVYEIEIEPSDKRMRGYSVYYMAGVLEKNEEEYLLLFSVPPTQVRKYRRSFQKTIQSFRFRDEVKDSDLRDDDEEEAPETDHELVGQEKRNRIKADLIDTWSFIDTPHYIVIYDCDHGLAKAIAERIERMRTQCFEQVFAPKEPITEVMVVRVCQDPATYRHYGGPPGSGGYWSSYHDELVFPDFARSKKPDEATLGVLHHEGFHQYIHYALRGRTFPIAFNEGFAEYFFCAEPRGRSKMTIGNRHPMRHSIVKTAAATGKLVETKTFVRFSQREHYANAGLHYAQGWAFCYWLMDGTKNEAYHAVPMKLYEALFEVSEEEALTRAFEGIDLDRMHEDFLKDLKRIM